MSDTSLTLFAFHLGDARIQLGPKTIGGSDEEPAESTPTDAAAASAADGSSGRCPVRSAAVAALLLGVVALLGAVTWKVVGGDDLDDAVALDELDG